MNRKNGFLTFVFACLFGAGQMYQGYMKRGLSIMLLTALDGILVNFFNNSVFMVLMPVIWAFAFFDTYNLRNQTDPRPDDFLLDVSGMLGDDWKGIIAKRHKLFGGILIALGVYALYKNFVETALWELVRVYNLSWLKNLLWGVPNLLVAALLVGLGVYLLKGPAHGKAADATGEDFVPYQGGGQDGQ